MRTITFTLTEDETTDGGKGWLVECPDIPGFKSHGDFIDDALEMAASLLQDLKRNDQAADPIWHGWLGDYQDAVSHGMRMIALIAGEHIERLY